MKNILVALCLFISLFGFSQEDAWVYFKNKPEASFYLANPTEMLSQKALDRRSKQGIALDEKDVPISTIYSAAITSATGITVMAKSKWMNALHIRGLQPDIEALKSLDFVERVDFADRTLNVAGRTAMPKQNTAVNKIMESEVTLAFDASANQIQMLNGHLLHQQHFTGGGMTIAVLDAGFPNVNTIQPFERLRTNNLIKGGYNYVTRSEDFYTGGTHGTLVLSTMGGYVEGEFTGTAPDASYYLFVTEDPTSENPVEESYWVEAAETADSLGVDVVNTSLGYFRYDDSRYSYSYEDIDGKTAFISRGADIAVSRGMFCVISAGNSGNTNTPNIAVPADAFTALTVGAVDMNRNYASFSSIGPTFDKRIKPDVMAKGSQSANSNVNGEITTGSGTSFASPITAGLVACLWQALPDKTNAEVLQLIKESADRYATPTPQYGYGIPDFYKAMEAGMNLTEEKFIIYPNPTNGTVHLLFPKDTPIINVTIFNNLGQKVKEQQVTLGNPSLFISELASGVYYYRLDGVGKNQKGKIIKQ